MTMFCFASFSFATMVDACALPDLGDFPATPVLFSLLRRKRSLATQIGSQGRGPDSTVPEEPMFCSPTCPCTLTCGFAAILPIVLEQANLPDLTADVLALQGTPQLTAALLAAVPSDPALSDLPVEETCIHVLGTRSRRTG